MIDMLRGGPFPFCGEDRQDAVFSEYIEEQGGFRIPLRNGVLLYVGRETLPTPHRREKYLHIDSPVVFARTACGHHTDRCHRYEVSWTEHFLICPVIFSCCPNIRSNTKVMFFSLFTKK